MGHKCDRCGTDTDITYGSYFNGGESICRECYDKERQDPRYADIVEGARKMLDLMNEEISAKRKFKAEMERISNAKIAAVGSRPGSERYTRCWNEARLIDPDRVEMSGKEWWSY